jgi:hypothetical protein
MLRPPRAALVFAVLGFALIAGSANGKTMPPMEMHHVICHVIFGEPLLQEPHF